MKDKLIKYWKKLKCWLAGEYAVFEVIYSLHPNPKRMASLLHDGFKANVYGEGGYTPLQLSLLFEQYECALVLLEQGADPNLRCLARENSLFDRGKTLQPYLHLFGSCGSPRYPYFKQQYTSIIKLLTLYGATEDGLRFYSRALRKEFDKAQELYQKKQVGEDFLEGATPLITLRCYQVLHEVWQQLSDEEVGDEPLQKTLRAHYQKKALFYAEKVRQLTPASAPSSPTPVTNSNLTEEAPCFSHPAHAYDFSNTLRKRNVSERELIYEEKIPLLKEYSQQP